MSPRSGPARPGSVRAFTLIELMISIALVLLLILGVNQVFTYTTQAVGAGEDQRTAGDESLAGERVAAGENLRRSAALVQASGA